MKKGKGGKVSGSATSTFDVDYDFELFPLNEDGTAIIPNPATSTVRLGTDEIEVTTYAFTRAIENFTGGYDINSTDFAENSSGIGGIWEYESVRIFNPLTLDLTARFLPAGTTLTLLNETVPFNLGDSNGDEILNDEIITESDRLEYILSSPELEARGIYEFTLLVEDQDPVIDGFQLDEEAIDTADATTNLESILEVLSFPGEQFRISATSESGQFFSIESGFNESTIFIEAEDILTPGVDTYLEEDFAAVRTNDETEPANAKGISLIDVEEGEGTASFVAEEYDLSGTYDLEISYFDENDGNGQLQVLINDAVVGELVFNETTSSGFPTEDTRREYTIEDLDINFSDTIALRGIADINDRGGEWVRIDDISFSPEGFLTSQPPEPIMLQAEDLNLSTYLIEDFSAIRTNDGTEPANATGISLLGATGDMGTAFLNANDPLLGGSNLSGIYDLGISYFDENDGEARIEVLINGEIARDINNEIVGNDLLLNANTNSGFPTEETRREYVFEDLLIRPDDEIAIRGIADINDRGSEWARVDFITFNVDTEIIFDMTTEL